MAKKKLFAKLEDDLKKLNPAALEEMAVLLPFKPMIKKHLEAKGVNTNKMHFKEMVKQFNEKIIGKNLDSFESNFTGEDHLVEDAIELVKTFLDFIHSIKDKKAGGGQLTTIESEILEHTNKVEGDLKLKEVSEQSKLNNDMQPTKAQSKIKPKHIVISVGVIVLIVIIYFIFRKK